MNESNLDSFLNFTPSIIPPLEYVSISYYEYRWSRHLDSKSEGTSLLLDHVSNCCGCCRHLCRFTFVAPPQSENRTQSNAHTAGARLSVSYRLPDRIYDKPLAFSCSPPHADYPSLSHYTGTRAIFANWRSSNASTRAFICPTSKYITASILLLRRSFQIAHRVGSSLYGASEAQRCILLLEVRLYWSTLHPRLSLILAFYTSPRCVRFFTAGQLAVFDKKAMCVTRLTDGAFFGERCKYLSKEISWGLSLLLSTQVDWTWPFWVISSAWVRATLPIAGDATCWHIYSQRLRMYGNRGTLAHCSAVRWRTRDDHF